MNEARKKFYYAVSGYLLTILIGLFLPELAIVLFFAVAVFLFIPFRTVAAGIFGAGDASALVCHWASRTLGEGREVAEVSPRCEGDDRCRPAPRTRDERP